MEEYKIILGHMPNELCSSEDESWWILEGVKNKPNDSVPYFHNKSICYYPLNTKFNQWCKDNNIQVNPVYSYEDRWHLIFSKKSDAMLFKLTWIGI